VVDFFSTRSPSYGQVNSHLQTHQQPKRHSPGARDFLIVAMPQSCLQVGLVQHWRPFALPSHAVCPSASAPFALAPDLICATSPNNSMAHVFKLAAAFCIFLASTCRGSSSILHCAPALQVCLSPAWAESGGVGCCAQPRHRPRRPSGLHQYEPHISSFCQKLVTLVILHV
jgi:hypothetical protein